MRALFRSKPIRTSLAAALGLVVAQGGLGCGDAADPPAGGSGGVTGSGGIAAGTGGAAGQGGVTGQGGSAGQDAAAADTGGASDAVISKPFSFFVTSLAAMQRLSGSQDGFGGDLRFGQADGLAGADEICRQIAEASLPGAGGKGWRAFLSVTKDGSGQPVNAIDRVGNGPWYDRLGRTVALTRANLAQTRPVGADQAIINDLPNEDGVPNHAPDGKQVDNHDILTGSDTAGKLVSTDWSATCHDWTSKVGRDGKPRVGHSWPRGGMGPIGGGGGPVLGMGSGNNWMSALDEAGCAPGVSLIEMGPPNPNDPTVGSGGGYGAIYCFALSP